MRRTARWPRFLALLAVFAVASCDDDDGGADAPDRGRDLTGTEDLAADEESDQAPDQAPDVSLEEVAADAPEAVEVTGLVAVFETRSPSVEALQSGGLAASFVLPGSAPEEPIATVGACDIFAVGPDDTLFPDVPSLDAGDIEVELGADTFTLALAEGGVGPRYVSNAPAERLEYFTNGLTVRVTAAGGADVPAFSGSVSAPAEPVIASPAWGAGTSGTHSVDQDLIVIWPATDRGDVVVNLVPIQVLPEPGLAEGNGITCTGEDSGSLTVPAAALAWLSGGGDFGPNVALTVIVPINATLRAGNSQITINATASHTVVGAIR